MTAYEGLNPSLPTIDRQAPQSAPSSPLVIRLRGFNASKHVKPLRSVSLVAVGLEHRNCKCLRRGVLHPCYIDTAVLSDKLQRPDGFEFRNWSGARDLNPGPHGPEM